MFLCNQVMDQLYSNGLTLACPLVNIAAFLRKKASRMLQCSREALLMSYYIIVQKDPPIDTEEHHAGGAEVGPVLNRIYSIYTAFHFSLRKKIWVIIFHVNVF